MDPWTWPAYVGVLWGLGLFAVLLLPIVVIQVRRYGDLNGRRLLGAAGLSVYAVALVAYTLLPLPPRSAAWCAAHGGGHGATLRPFHSWDDIRTATAGVGLRATLLHRVTLQVVFNVVLFVPLGVWCRRFFQRGLVAATAIGLAVSLAIESTQGTGVWGLYPCSYRFADVDDLITNTTGAFLGAAAAWLFLFWMPQSSRLAAARLHRRPVTVRRRWTAMGLDALVVTGGVVVTAMAVRVGLLAAGRPAPVTPLPGEVLAAALVPLVLLVLVPASLGDGASIGQRLLWLTPRWRRSSAGWRRWLRALMSVGPGLAAVVPATVGPAGARGPAAVAAVVVVVVSGAAAVGTAGHRGLSGALAGAEVVDARTGPDEEGRPGLL